MQPLIVRISLALGLMLLIAGAILAFGPAASAVGLLLMLCSLPPFFLAVFIHLLGGSRSADQSSGHTRDEP